MMNQYKKLSKEDFVRKSNKMINSKQGGSNSPLLRRRRTVQQGRQFGKFNLKIEQQPEVLIPEEDADSKDSSENSYYSPEGTIEVKRPKLAAKRSLMSPEPLVFKNTSYKSRASQELSNVLDILVRPLLY